MAGRFLVFEGDDRGFGDMIGMSLARLFRQAFGVMNLLLQPLLLLPFRSLWAVPEEALFEAPFCNLFHCVFGFGGLGGFRFQGDDSDPIEVSGI